MKQFRDEAVLATGLSTAFLLTKSAVIFKEWAVWSSITVLCLTTLYYSYTFFQSSNRSLKLAFFLIQALFVIVYFALIYQTFGIIDSSSGEMFKPGWLDSLYFSVVTWTTLGFGDFRPVHEAKIWVMAEALLGYIFMGLFLAKVLFLMQMKAPTETSKK